jgi:hypothetical protein
VIERLRAAGDFPGMFTQREETSIFSILVGLLPTRTRAVLL